MHMNCVICSELLTANSDIYSTQCGHIFHLACLFRWLKNSKTCPQCRQETSLETLIRLFVNTSTTPGFEADAPVEEPKMDILKFVMKLKEKDRELQSIKARNQERRSQIETLCNKIVELEMANAGYKNQITKLNKQIGNLKTSCNMMQEEVITSLMLELNKTRNELAFTKKKITALESNSKYPAFSDTSKQYSFFKQPPVLLEPVNFEPRTKRTVTFEPPTCSKEDPKKDVERLVKKAKTCKCKKPSAAEDKKDQENV